MVDRHDGRYSAFLSARRQRRISAHSRSLSFLCLTSPQFLFGTVPRARDHAILRLQFSGTRERMMRKTRDYDAELKALGDKARALKVKKVQQLGELVTSTGADALDLDTLAGALLAAEIGGAHV